MRSGRKRKTRGFNPAEHDFAVQRQERRNGQRQNRLKGDSAEGARVDTVLAQARGAAMMRAGTPEHWRRRAEIVGPENVLTWDGTQIHACFLRGFLAEREYAAGRKFDSLTRLYLRYLCAPNVNGAEVRDISQIASSKGGAETILSDASLSDRKQRTCDDEVQDSENDSDDADEAIGRDLHTALSGTSTELPGRFEDPDSYRVIKDAYENAYCAMGKHKSKRAVVNLLRENHADLSFAKKGLAALADFWGITHAIKNKRET